jgi:hypothetical protein
MMQAQQHNTGDKNMSNSQKKSMVMAAYGGGTNSTAMIIKWLQDGNNIDLILFADTGAEKPHTYDYVEYFSSWLVDNYGISIVTVRSTGKTLYQDCIDRKALPSLAYGFKTCSQRFKLQPQDKYLNNHALAKTLWKKGEKITKLVGFDAGEDHRIKNYDDKKYTTIYPLVDADIDRDGCIEIIVRAGLKLPGKSACYFCPSSRPSEVLKMGDEYPDLLKKAVEMEKNANLTSVKGLGRNFSWGDLSKQTDIFGYAPIIACECID